MVKRKRDPVRNDESVETPVEKPSKTSKTEDIVSEEATTEKVQEPPPKQLKVLDRKADIFSAPPSTILLHSCNTIGSWGAGVAAAFKKRYPNAYKANVAHCRSSTDKVLGSALLVPPEDDSGHFVACLFTSTGVGRKKSKPDVIVENTKIAMGKLLEQIKEYNDEHEPKLERLWMVKINSGLFKVPWERTLVVLEEIKLPAELELEVVAVST